MDRRDIVQRDMVRRDDVLPYSSEIEEGKRSRESVAAQRAAREAYNEAAFGERRPYWSAPVRIHRGAMRGGAVGAAWLVAEAGHLGGVGGLSVPAMGTG